MSEKYQSLSQVREEEDREGTKSKVGKKERVHTESPSRIHCTPMSNSLANAVG